MLLGVQLRKYYAEGAQKIKVCGEQQMRAIQRQETRSEFGTGSISQKGWARAASHAERMGKVGGCAELGIEMEQPRYKHQGTALALTEGNGPTPIDVNEG